MTGPDTYYQRGATDTKERAALTGDHTVQTAIIGGGLAGVTLARELAVAGQVPVLLEAEQIGFGASGRNGGFVTPGFAAGDKAIRARVGDAHADELFALSLDALSYVRARISDMGPDAQIQLQDGIMGVCRTPGNDALLQDQEWLALRGYDTTLLSVEEVRSRARSARYFEALRSDHGFHIHPLNYLLGLAQLAEDAGAQLFPDSPVRKLTRRADGQYLLETDDGTLRAEQVVVATGGYTGPLVPKLHRAFVPVATYVIGSEQAPDLLAEAITTTDAIADHRRAGDYYRLVDGGTRLLWGGGISVRDRNPAGVMSHLRASILDTYPQLAPLKFETAWSGWMSYARHQMPQVGQLAPGLWHLTGFGGHGLNTTAAAAQLIAEALTEHSDRWRLFEPWGLDWAGGPVGRLAAQSCYSWLRWRDHRDEARIS